MHGAVGRSDGRTVGRALAVTLLFVSPTVRLSAQVSLQAAAGLRYTSALVHDSIVAPFDVRPALAPALAVSAATPLNDPWSAVATLDFSWSRLERHDQDGTTVDLGGLGALAVTVGVARRLAPGLVAVAAIGGLGYVPASDRGIFAQGAGGVTPLGALGVSYAPPLGGGAGRRLALRAGYDIHRFLTPALRNEGFTTGRTVHRATVAVQWSFGGGDVRP
jgi:hypothetical protein